MSVITSGHPSMAALAAFALGKLDAAAAETVHNHLAGCPECRTVVETTPSDTLMGLLKRAGTKPGDTPSLAASILKGAPAVPKSDFDVAGLPTELRDHPRYRILRKLGEGGMGAVYEAEHRMMERVVAIKVIAGNLVDSPDAIERFQREVRAAAKLEHANIVRAYDADQAGGMMLLAMEFVKGRTLAEVVTAKGPLPIAYACQCIRQAALGLQHAADNQMVHRDIKPQNLMLTEKGVVKILDFGLAKLVSERLSRPGLTGKDIVMGTPEYMAPEQARDTASADIRADIYALGCTLFFLLTGKPPFSGSNAIEIVTKQLMDAPPRVTDLRPDVSAELADLVGRMLAKEAAERPQTPKEVAEALKAFTKTTVPGASRALPAVDLPIAETAARTASESVRGPAATRRPRWLMPAAAGVLLTAIIAATAIWVKTSAGYVWIEVKPDDAEVRVDGELITVKPYKITVDAKEHHLVVSKDGFESRGESVSLKDGGRTISVKLVANLPAVVPPMDRIPDAAGLKRIAGNWTVQGEELIQADPKEWAIVHFGDTRWTDYDFSVDAQRNKGGAGFTIHYRCANDTTQHRFPVGGWGNTANGINVVTDGVFQQLFSKPFRIVNNQWYRALVKVRGNRFETFLDGEKMFEYRDDRCPNGRVGLQTNSACRFRNIKVAAPDGTVLWSGLPGGK